MSLFVQFLLLFLFILYIYIFFKFFYFEDCAQLQSYPKPVDAHLVGAVVVVVVIQNQQSV